MPNADAVGYYRWSVPSEMMQTLAKNAVASLDAAERVSLLGNLEALLNAGQITGDAYARALPQFADDPEPAVTSALIGGLTKVRQSFVPDDLRGAFAPYVRQVLGPAAQRIGYDRRPGESERAALVRPQLMNALGYLGRDEATLKAADRIAKSYLADPSSVDPGAAGSSLQLVALKGDRAMFDDFKQRFETSKVPATARGSSPRSAASRILRSRRRRWITRCSRRCDRPTCSSSSARWLRRRRRRPIVCSRSSVRTTTRSWRSCRRYSLGTW
jgi:alanyl aminopeptidase